MSSADIRNYAVAALALAGIASLAFITIEVRRAVIETRSAMTEVRSAARETKIAANKGKQYLIFQTEVLKSDEYQRSLKSTARIGLSAQETFRRVNTETIPRLNAVLDEAARTTGQLRQSVARTDAEINGRLIPEVANLVRAFEGSPAEIAAALKVVTDKTALTLDDARAILASEEWQEIRRNLALTSAEVAASSAQVTLTSTEVAEASRRLPFIADRVNQILTTSSRWQKSILLAQLLGALIGAFR